MSAIPSSNLQGHKKLHERVYNALDRCQESKSTDFKESAPWDELKWRIIRTTLAMANLSDGGIIVIGASERDDTWDLAGSTEENLSTYDVDVVIDIINKYASPPIKVELVTVNYRNGNLFLAIQVHEFTNSPFVCKKNGPDDYKELRVGDLFIRPDGKAQTKRITSAEDMQDLLELAAEKRARKILEVARRIGLKATPTHIEKFEEELKGL